MNYIDHVKKKDVAKAFNVSLDKVQQIGSKQLFIVYLEDINLLVSYLTAVGIFIPVNRTWYITKCKYSPTTSRQIKMFTSSINAKVCYVEEEITSSKIAMSLIES